MRSDVRITIGHRHSAAFFTHYGGQLSRRRRLLYQRGDYIGNAQYGVSDE